MPAKAKANAAKPHAARKPTTPPRARASKPRASLRKPSAPRSVDDFVTQETGGAHHAERVGSARAEPTRSATSKKRAPLVTRRDGSARRRTTVYLEPEVSRRLHVHCALDDVEMSHEVSQAIDAWLRHKGR